MGKVTIPRRIEATDDLSEWTPDRVTVDLTIEYQDGRLALTELRLRQQDGAPPITGELLRRIPVATLVRSAVAAATALDGLVWNKQHEGRHPMALTPEERRALPEADRLDALAVVYTYWWLTEGAPTQAVAAFFGVSEATARRWAAKARERGLLAVAEGGSTASVTVEASGAGTSEGEV